MEDKQKQRCYLWEMLHVHPYDTKLIPFHQITSIVDYVWTQEGLLFPPKVEILSKSKSWAKGCRTELLFRIDKLPNTSVILHELSHSMTFDHNMNGNHHGALFMGIYIQLLKRYMNMDSFKLIKSAEDLGLKVKIDAKPIFI